MAKWRHQDLSRREAQIMDVVYSHGQATVAEMQKSIREEVSYNSVRVIARILEEKGYLKHERDGNRYVYAPVISAERASRSAVSHLLKTFFDGSTPRAVTALIDIAGDRLSHEELDDLSRTLERVKKEKRR